MAAFILLAAPGQAEAANRYWVLASGTGNWNDTANWSTASGGAGGASVPGSADIARFGVDTTKDGDCTFDVDVETGGLDVRAGYNGTIRQNGRNAWFGGSHFKLAGGTYIGGGTLRNMDSWGVIGQFQFSGGTFDANGGKLDWRHASQGGDVIVGSVTLYDLEINEGWLGTIPGGTTVTVMGTLTLVSAGIGRADAGTVGEIHAKGNVAIGAGWSGLGNLGPVVPIIINGVGDQTLSGVPCTTAPYAGVADLQINKTTGTLAISGTVDISRPGWTHTAGAVNGTGTVRFKVGGPDINGNAVLPNVTIILDLNSGDVTIPAGSSLTTGNLTLTDGVLIGTGSVNVQGNLTIASTFDGLGGQNDPVPVNFTAAGNQTITHNAGALTEFGAWTINKPSGGTVTLATNVNLNDSETGMTVTAGTLDLAGKTLTVAGTLTNNGIITSSGSGKAITAGTLTGASTSQITYNGVAGDTAVTLEDGTYGKLTVNNPGTTFSLSGATTVQGNLEIGGGTLDATASNHALTVNGNWTNGGTFNGRSGTVTFNGAGGVQQSISGATTFYKLTKNSFNGASLVFPAGVTTTVQNTLALAGVSVGNLLAIRSSSAGSAALLNLQSGGSSSIDYVDVKDSNASGGIQLVAYGSTDSGNNTNWDFQPDRGGTIGSALVAHWKFDNNANDSKGTNHGTLVGNAAYSTDVPSSLAGSTYSLSLDGTGDYVTVPNAAALNLATSFTVTMWVKRTALGQWDSVYDPGTNAGRWWIELADTTNGNYSNYYEEGGLDFFATSNAISDTSSWYHVAVVKNGNSGTNIFHYVNGVASGTASAGSVTTPSGTKRIGSDNTVSDDFPGLIDDVRVYNRALTQAEIQTVMTVGGAGSGVLTLSDTDSASTTVTNSTSVTASFASLEGGASAYVLSNTANSFGGTTAIPATPAFATTWTLSSGDGDKTVFARITNGGTYDIADTITLDTAPPTAPSALALTANADNTGINATVTAPAGADLSKLLWRYTAVDGNVAASYPASSGAGTAFGTGVTNSAVPSSSNAMSASSLAQFKTYGVSVWAQDTAGNVSTLAAQASIYLSPPTPRLVVTAPSGSAAAGGSVTLTITAKDADGTVLTNYAGPYTLTWTPTGGSAVTLVDSSSSGFSGGVVTAAVSVGGTNAGSGSFTATDGSGSGLTNGTLSFVWYPSSFTVTTDSATLTAGKAFSLTVTAKDSAGVTMTRYAGTVNLSISATPSAVKTLNTAAMTVTGGSSTLSTLSYPDWASNAAITAQDTTYASGITISGTSSALTFGPSKFAVAVGSPPPSRSAWYLSEPVRPVTVTAQAEDGTTLVSYRGTVTFTAVSGLTMPENYTFTAGDAGVHEFTTLTSSTAGSYTLQVKDSVSTSAVGTSGPVVVILARIVVASVSGPVGTLAVPVRVVDAVGNIVQDSTTMFTVTLAESGNGSAGAAVSSVRFTNGQLQLSITDSEAEKVTVGGTSNPQLPVSTGIVEFGSSDSTYASSFQYVQYEQTPGSYTIVSPYANFNTGSATTIYAGALSQFSGAAPSSGQGGVYDSGLYAGLAALQSGNAFTSYFSQSAWSGQAPSTVFQQGAFSPFSGQQGNASFTPGSYALSPAAFQAATRGMPPGLVGAMQQGYFGGKPGDFGTAFQPGSFSGPYGPFSGSKPGDFSGPMPGQFGPPGRSFGEGHGDFQPPAEWGMGPTDFMSGMNFGEAGGAWMMPPGGEGTMMPFDGMGMRPEMGEMPSWMQGPMDGGMGFSDEYQGAQGGQPSSDGASAGGAGTAPAEGAAPTAGGAESAPAGASDGQAGQASDSAAGTEAPGVSDAGTTESGTAE